MINYSDEFLNKLIDGDLNSAEEQELKAELSVNNDLSRRYDMLLLVHKTLQKQKPDELPDIFTKNVMNRIRRKALAPSEQKYFMFGIVTVFAVIIIGIVSFITASIISSTSSSASFNFNGIISFVQNLFAGSSLSIIGYSFSILLIISIYFLIDTIKGNTTSRIV